MRDTYRETAFTSDWPQIPKRVGQPLLGRGAEVTCNQ